MYLDMESFFDLVLKSESYQLNILHTLSFQIDDFLFELFF